MIKPYIPFLLRMFVEQFYIVIIVIGCVRFVREIHQSSIFRFFLIRLNGAYWFSLFLSLSSQQTYNKQATVKHVSSYFILHTTLKSWWIFPNKIIPQDSSCVTACKVSSKSFISSHVNPPPWKTRRVEKLVEPRLKITQSWRKFVKISRLQFYGFNITCKVAVRPNAKSTFQVTYFRNRKLYEDEKPPWAKEWSPVSTYWTTSTSTMTTSTRTTYSYWPNRREIRFVESSFAKVVTVTAATAFA